MTTVIYHDFPKSVYKDGYVAVSHVWGKQTLYSPKNLGINNGVDWEVPLSSIDKMDMLKSAMRKFNMEWCWWDVLCMPQGDKNQEEVNKEIPFMGEYYNGSKITLVLSDEEYPEMNGDPRDNIVVKFLNKGIAKAASHTSIYALLDNWKFSEISWINRLWTFQEAVLSNKIWLVTPSNLYLDVSSAMERAALSNMSFFYMFDSDDFLMNVCVSLSLAIKNYKEHRTNVGKMLRDCSHRNYHRPQDKYYGMLGVLGYTKFPVTYDITMEELGKKFMEHAYYNGDVSWLAIHGKTSEFISQYKYIKYIGDLWREEKPGICNVKFKENTIWLNTCIVASVNCRDLASRSWDNWKINAYRGWGFGDHDIIRALTGHCKLSDKETKSMKNYRLEDESKRTTLQYIMIDTKIANKGTIELHEKRRLHMEEMHWACKITCITGESKLIFVCGECDIGDKIMILPMYDTYERVLGLVVDNTLKRKGICLYPRLDISYKYTPYEFPL
jgi:hypothetical protein